MDNVKSCEVCGNKAEQSCSGCNISAYCGREHQKEDWKGHKRLCRTMKLMKDGKAGRYLIAKRDIKAGEILFTEEPIAIGPRASSTLICLGCHTTIVKEEFEKCAECSWPICSSQCALNERHLAECNILRKDEIKCGVPQQHGETPRYDLILVLRCLLLRSTKPSTWKKLMSMESHAQKRKEEAEAHHMAAVRYFTEVVKVESDVDIVHHARGAIITNCYETKGPSESSLRGVYPLLGLINHSCIPNATLRADRGGKMYVMATVPISSGEMFSLAYTGTTTPVWERINYTRDVHYFTCNCPRCLSKTELGSYFSSPRCLQCKYVAMTPNDSKEKWQCSKCDYEVPSNEVLTKCESFLEYLQSAEAIGEGTVKDIQKLMAKVELSYHRKHFLWMCAAQNSIRVLSQNDSIEALRFRKILWEGLLSIFSIIEPGKTRRRGMTLLELAITELALLDKISKVENIVSEISFNSQLEKLKMLNEAEEILRLEPSDSYELKWLERAQGYINKVGTTTEK